jgi:hypothetical protein
LLLSGPGWLSVDGLVKQTLSPSSEAKTGPEAESPSIPAGSSHRTAIPLLDQLDQEDR